ncbi:exodeoxyribonuclease V subunit alpha [Aldersonia sp. NBC_00410]|uniref:exodeoxyribonuclease V subunit alpha n=1 Tax=Aldersonia sp. NBC_00410 TaxID=2975954 RepID=UPI00225A2474|nr:exodeoxyribonuclease V subunit alpha [Aldersonia sp. NBC_00410]MCX5044397.1 exodeoxyribonuclease V subunit alpha [Aldersonia sp. NBC_00410]
MTEAQLAQRGTGVLRTFNDAGVLAAADVHVASRLRGLSGERSEAVLLAVALAVRAVRAGSVCLDLNRFADVSLDEDSEIDVTTLPWPDVDEVIASLRRSPLVIGAANPADGTLRPLRLVDTDEGALLYLDRYFRQEQTIRRILDDRAGSHPEVDPVRVAAALETLFRDGNDDSKPAPAPDRQRVAAALAAAHWTTIIAGGPGTGKTHTVARILALLTELSGSRLRVGLAAPTGKAAARLQESVREQAGDLHLPPDLSAATLHRMLGWQPGSRTRFRHDQDNRLPYDVVVVDETSMVSLTMMCRLLEAVRPDARLLLVGDPDQLTSVDAGAVLADLVGRPIRALPNAVADELVRADLDGGDDPQEAALGRRERDRLRGGIVRLSRGRRFRGAIADLAVAVRDGNADRAIEVLQSGADEVSLHPADDVADLRRDLVDTAKLVTDAAEDGDAGEALLALEQHRLLCAHRHGPHGVDQWARRATEWIATDSGRGPTPGRWFPGQPLLVTTNDHELRIYNGDTGVIVRRADGELTAAFARGKDVVHVHPTRLPAAQTVYAMTIHRSQGSQYDTVSVLLPPESSSLLTRELLYTAITRARRHVRVIGTPEAVRFAVGRQVLRASGLRRTIRAVS